jgi:heme/copper-type cytochrome/quinol oxidase subunit 2
MTEHYATKADYITLMSTQVDTTTPSPSEKVTGAMTDVKTIEMEAGSFYYNPKSVTVKKGQKVVINLKAVDMMHNINIDELNVHSKTVSSGSTITVEFVADKVGTYEYYCAVGQHRQKGQVGTLVVQ